MSIVVVSHRSCCVLNVSGERSACVVTRVLRFMRVVVCCVATTVVHRSRHRPYARIVPSRVCITSARAPSVSKLP